MNNVETMYTENIKLVPYTIRKYFPYLAHDEDWEQIANIGLWKACKTYQEEKGSFSNYAITCIKNAIKYEQRKFYTKNEQAKAEWKEVELNEEYQSPVEDDHSWMYVEDMIKCLTPREQDMIRYMLCGWTKSEIARKYNLSFQRVSYIFQGAYKKMRRNVAV